MKKRPPGITRGRLPISSSMPQPIRDTARNVNQEHPTSARNHYVLLTHLTPKPRNGRCRKNEILQKIPVISNKPLEVSFKRPFQMRRVFHVQNVIHQQVILLYLTWQS